MSCRVDIMIPRRAVVLAGFGNPMVHGRPCLPVKTANTWKDRVVALEVAEFVMKESKLFYVELLAEGWVTPDAERHFLTVQEVVRDHPTFSPMAAEMASDAGFAARFEECIGA